MAQTRAAEANTHRCRANRCVLLTPSRQFWWDCVIPRHSCTGSVTHVYRPVHAMPCVAPTPGLPSFQPNLPTNSPQMPPRLGGGPPPRAMAFCKLNRVLRENGMQSVKDVPVMPSKNGRLATTPRKFQLQGMGPFRPGLLVRRSSRKAGRVRRGRELLAAQLSGRVPSRLQFVRSTMATSPASHVTPAHPIQALVPSCQVAKQELVEVPWMVLRPLSRSRPRVMPFRTVMPPRRGIAAAGRRRSHQ